MLARPEQTKPRMRSKRRILVDDQLVMSTSKTVNILLKFAHEPAVCADFTIML